MSDVDAGHQPNAPTSSGCPRVRFHLDEDLNGYPAIARALASKGIDATTVATANLLGASDERQLEFAAQEGRILVTHNIKDFARLHQQRQRHSGIFCLVQGRRSLGEVIELLAIASELVTPEEMRDRLDYL